MAMTDTYAEKEPARAEVDATRGPLVLEFGNAWCGFCAAAQSLLKQAFEGYPQVEHIKIADGRGRRLGRTFGVKLWPTLIFLRDGEELERLVRPQDAEAIAAALARIAGEEVAS